MKPEKKVELVFDIGSRILANTSIRDAEFARQKAREWLRG